jgi:hypothetical protein
VGQLPRRGVTNDVANRRNANADPMAVSTRLKTVSRSRVVGITCGKATNEVVIDL